MESNLIATVSPGDVEHFQERFNAWLDQEINDFCQCDICKRVMDNHKKVRDETEQIRNKARQDFIAVIPELWS